MKKGTKKVTVSKQEIKQKETVPHHKPVQNLTGIDTLRGIAVILMILTHVWIILFWGNSNILGKSVSFIGGYISFAIFLLLSGFLIGYKYKTLKLKNILIKSGILVLIYLFLAIIYLIPREGEFRQLLTAPIYLEEYLISLALFPIVGYFVVETVNKIPQTKRFFKSALGVFIVAILGVVMVLLGKFTASYNSNFAVSILFGSVNHHTFSLLSYAIIFFTGAWLGWSRLEETRKDFNQESLFLTLFSVIVVIVSLFTENISFTIDSIDAIRWPPTLFFIFSSLAVSILLLLFVLTFEFKRFKPVQEYLIKPIVYIGKRSIYFVVIHLLILYILEPYAQISFVSYQTYGKIVQTIDSYVKIDERIIETLKNSYKTREEWPFAGHRAVVLQGLGGLEGDIHIEVRPAEVGTNLSGYDITLYAKQGNDYKRIDTNIVLGKSQEYYANAKLNQKTDELIVSFLQDGKIPSRNDMQQRFNNNTGAKGRKVFVINRETKSWIHRPYTIEGKKWLLQDKDTNATEKIKVYLPLSCVEKTLLEKQSISLSFFDKTKRLDFIDCKDTDAVQVGDLLTAKSYVHVETDVTEIRSKIGEQLPSYELKLFQGEENQLVDTFLLQRQVIVSKPVWIMWSLDWEGFSVPYAHMDHIERIRQNSPSLKITHMLNPRAWNSGAVSKANADAQINFVKDKKNKYGDEIALHLHMFKDMVGKAGVTPIPEAGWAHREDGYDMPFTKYSYEESRKIFHWAVNEFPKKGLPKPKIFRAGGWFADLETLRAARDEGIIIDTSGRNAYNTIAFGGRSNILTGPWSLQNTTQPYWLSRSNQNRVATSTGDRLIYEIPTNGGDSWAFSAQTMIDRFKENYGPDILEQARAVTYLSHPEFFNKEGPKIEETIRYINYYSNNADSGPVVYITLEEYYAKYAK
jgi:hypothetical protein